MDFRIFPHRNLMVSTWFPHLPSKEFDGLPKVFWSCLIGIWWFTIGFWSFLIGISWFTIHFRIFPPFSWHSHVWKSNAETTMLSFLKSPWQPVHGLKSIMLELVIRGPAMDRMSIHVHSWCHVVSLRRHPNSDCQFPHTCQWKCVGPSHSYGLLCLLEACTNCFPQT